MRKGMILAAVMLSVALTGLTGCASGSAQNTVSNDVAAVEVSLTAAERLALVYTKLPRCGSSGATAVCSAQATVDSIKALDMKAYNAVQAAKANSSLLSLAVDAVSNLSAAVPKS